MKVLILGSTGFVGGAVREAVEKDHKVFGTSKEKEASADKNVHFADLLDKQSIVEMLKQVQPDAIVNCAGIVENSEKAKLNVDFTSNLLEAVAESGCRPKKIVICGSAAEYGPVAEGDIPVAEDVPRNANSLYGQSKRDEVDAALRLGEAYHLPVVVARIFNPIGSGMHPRMLIPGLIRQIEEIKQGIKENVEISRKDSQRDYINVRDLAAAVKLLVENPTQHKVYNIGSGESTSNEQLVDMALENSGLSTSPPVTEQSPQPEPVYARQADISRLKNEFGWEPQATIEDTIKEIVHATKD